MTDIAAQEREAQLRKMEREAMEKVSMTNVAGTLQSIFKPMAKGWSAFPRSFKNARQLRREGRTQDARSVYEYILNNALDPEDKRKAQKGLDACRA
jgi:hypothetical protein